MGSYMHKRFYTGIILTLTLQYPGMFPSPVRWHINLNSNLSFSREKLPFLRLQHKANSSPLLKLYNQYLKKIQTL